MTTNLPTTSRSALGALALAGIASLICTTHSHAQGMGNHDYDLPQSIQLSGVVRDFRERSAEGGHPDFEKRPDLGFGHYSGNVAPTLGDDGKPSFTGDGFKVTSQWKDAEGRPICYLLYDESRGDQEGSQGSASRGGIQSSASFSQWFNDVPGVNMSTPLTLTLDRQDDGTYVFDDKEHGGFEDLGGFFPIEDQLFGNPGGSPDRNFHFTLELHTEFTYDESSNPIFKFIGDDDVWVYIDGRLVIDLGGVHAATEQYVDLTRLGLTNGETYRLDFFFAERHRTLSNFRIQTNLNLLTVSMPPITAAFD
jgi:fibro-slime domain-containing protein